MREYPQSDDTMRWVRRGSALAVLLIGWVFILVTNNFHITPPVVFVCLGYFAAVAAIYTLYRLGATAVTETNEEDDAMSWVKPLGALDELEREKRALLKAIKEAEFDQQMGKLSKADAESMIAIYRGRAIEVIKEIDVQNSTSGKAGTVRDRILREARARIHVEEKSKDAAAPGKKKKPDKGDKKKDRADKLADAVGAAEKAKSAEPDDKGIVADKPNSEVVDHGEMPGLTVGEAAVLVGALPAQADNAAAKADDKAAAKADDNAAAKADDNAAAKADDKAAAKTDDKAAAKADDKAAAKADDNAAAKADDKAADNAAAKADDKAAAKTDDKAAAKTDDKAATNPADKAATDKPAADKADKPDDNSAADKPAAAKEATS